MGDPRPHGGDAIKDRWARAEANQDDAGIRARVIAANVAGAALVAVQATVIGYPARSGSHFRHDNVVSASVGIAYLVAAVVIVDLRTRRGADRTFGWIGERRQPTPTELTAVLDYAWRQAREILAWWLGAALIYFTLNLGFGNGVVYCLRTALSMALGGLTSSALSFLLIERFNRPVFVVALAGEAMGASGRLGLRRRLMLIWALGAAVPVLVIVSAPAGLSAAHRAALAVPLVIVGAVGLAAGLVLTVVASRSITEPLDLLRGVQRQVEAGELDVEVPVDDGGEIGLLEAGFNRMVAGLRERQRIRDLFGRHVGYEVARQALNERARFDGELTEASVLFVDLIGSTSMAQQLPPQQVVAVLNEFFSAVVRCAAAEDGWVNKFEGDAALCVFGPPGNGDGHPARALRAARSLRVALADLAQRHSALDAGIGVSAGTVVVGNIGAEDRYEYTVIGDPVNEAARLTEEAKAEVGRVLASGTAIALAGEEAQYWARGGTQVLRGRAGATELYYPISSA
jgi:adenylate cyclase